MNKQLRLFLILLVMGVSVLQAQTTLEFSGLTWIVKSGFGGPGPNHWSDSHESVWVDQNGYLHLKIRKEGDNWLCSEIYTRESFGYGMYQFLLGSNVEEFDSNIVTGLFTYETDDREIDIEFSRWGDPGAAAGWFTIQPPPYTGNQYNFPLNLNHSLSTHRFFWKEDAIQFQSYRGQHIGSPPADSLIAAWTYEGSKIPPSRNERLHLNFWLVGGNPPANLMVAELIIRAVLVPGHPQDIDKAGNHDGFNVFPVPADMQLFITIPGISQSCLFSLYNATGVAVFRQETRLNQLGVDVSDFSSGFYIAEILVNGRYIRRKIRIEH